jgi:hypothetical protein
VRSHRCIAGGVRAVVRDGYARPPIDRDPAVAIQVHRLKAVFMNRLVSIFSVVAVAGCAGGSIGIGGFGGGAGGGVGVGVSAPIGGSAPYVVSEGEQVIQPGMTSAEVIARLGHPYYQFGVRQDNATIWNYRMRYGSCLIYQVTMLPNGIVKEAGTGPDPTCNAPDRRR